MKRIQKIGSWISGIAVYFLIIMLLGGISVNAGNDLEVHFLNVGQGDSTLLTCGGHAMLIDAGGNDDIEPVLNYIQNKQGLTYLDYVIGTHPHEDHIGALDDVINTVGVGSVMLPDITTNTQAFMDVLTAIDNNGLQITVPEVGQVYELGSASFMILGPVNSYGDELNNWSVAVKVEYGSSRFLFTGDAEAAAEQDIVDTGIDISCDVFKAGHHGSDTSNSDYILNAASPAYAVISCGANNSYGHPGTGTLTRFRQHGLRIFRTDTQGTIVATSDGGSVSWSTAPSTDMDAGNAIANDTEAAYMYAADSGGAIEQTEAPQTAGVIVHITKTGEKYHSAGCQYLRKSDIEISLESAKAQGYTPCSKCGPPM